MKHNVIYANVTHEKGAIKILPQCGREVARKLFTPFRLPRSTIGTSEYFVQIVVLYAFSGSAVFVRVK